MALEDARGPLSSDGNKRRAMPDGNAVLWVLPERTTQQEGSRQPSRTSAYSMEGNIHPLPINHPNPAHGRNEAYPKGDYAIPSTKERSSPVSESRSNESQISAAVAEQDFDIGWIARRVAAQQDQERLSRAPDEQGISHIERARNRVWEDGEQQRRPDYDEQDERHLEFIRPQEEAQGEYRVEDSMQQQGQPGPSVQERRPNYRADNEGEENVEKPVLDSLGERHHGQGTRDFEYTPIEYSEIENEGYRKLDFKPLPMRTWFLAVTVVIYLSCIVAIAGILVWSRRNGGIHHIHAVQGALACRYVPPAVGLVTVIWWRTMITTFSRISPYISMAAKSSPKGSSGLEDRKAQRTLHASYADAMFTPDFFHLPSLALNGHWLLFAATLVSLIVNVFLMGLKAAFVQTTPKGAEWNIAVSAKIGYTLISIYGSLSVTAVAILIRLRHRDTGLKWDPVSVADQLALLQNSNIGQLFAGLETCSFKEYRESLRKRALNFGPIRLGYWKNRRNGAIWHGIALTPKPAGTGQFLSWSTLASRMVIMTNNTTATATAEDNKSQVGVPVRKPSDRNGHAETSITICSKDSPQVDEEVRPMTTHASTYPLSEMPVDSHGHLVTRIGVFSHCSGLLTDWILAIYSTTALTVLALVILGLLNGYLQRGIHIKAASLVSNVPHINANSVGAREWKTEMEASVNSPMHVFWSTSDVSKPYNFKEAFLFQFLPVTFMGFWFSLLWINVDHFYRYTQPFAGMDIAAPAASNILLEYPNSMPILITCKAIANKHWRVALFSLLSLAASVPPIIASGIFVGIPDTTGFTEHIQPVNFWASFSVLVTYFLCIILARPTQSYRLPRYGIYTIGDLIQWCYASRIFDEELHGRPIFYVQDAKDDKIQLLSRIHLAKRNYQFGLYLGIDGRRHLGFDIAERKNASGRLEYVDRIESGPALYFRLDGRPWHFRRPRIVRRLE